MEKTALIMAGGRGERFWPRSRRNRPKQFLCLTNDGKTMIQHTVERILPLVRMENIYVSTNQSYKALVREQLPELPEENILCEPVGKNTAPCIGLASVFIRKKFTDAIMIVLPSDHLVKYGAMFLNTLKDACDAAEQNGNLLTVGIMPSSPETGYGYIKFNPNAMEKSSYRCYPVDQFVEKPDLDTAKKYLSSGQYLWNSGMFVWKISSILEQFRALQPGISAGLDRIGEAIGTDRQKTAIEDEFRAFPSVSVDYGIMEKSDSIYTIPGTFGWDDVGSWLALERINPTDDDDNLVTGNVVSVNTNSCIISAGEKLIATVGVKNLVVIDTPDATLICRKDSTQDIKKIIENLKICHRDQYI